MVTRIGVMSDLHIEIDRRRGDTLSGMPDGHPGHGPVLVDLRGRVDAVVLAGDIDNGVAAIAYGEAVSRFLDVPVVMVAGNHEFYRHERRELLGRLSAAAADTGGRVVFLENGGARLTLNGGALDFLGATLWTDLELYGSAAAGELRQADELLAMYDYKRILGGDGGLISPDEPIRWHRESRGWLERTLAACDGPAVVVTHHAVSERSVAGRFRGSRMNAAFVSDLEALIMARAPALWVHGHTHHSVDYRLGATRVVSRQRGYPGELAGPFEPLVVDLDA